MKKAFNITCIIDGLFDIAYRPAPLTVIEEDEEKAKEKAVKQLEDWYGKKKNRYHISIEKIEPIDGPLGRITVLMEHYGQVDTSKRILENPTIVQTTDGKDFTVETVSQQGNRIAVSGYGNERWDMIPIHLIKEGHLTRIADALEHTVGKDAKPLLPQFLLLEDMFNATSPYGDTLPSGVFGKTKDDIPLKVSMLKEKEYPTTIIIHKVNGYHCEQALLIPETAMEEVKDDICKLQEFCD